MESGKGQTQRIARPVLFGQGGRAERSFLVDAFQATTGMVLEVEAGRAVINDQVLKDLFEACAIQDACYLAIAEMNEYKPKSAKVSLKDFATSGSDCAVLPGLPGDRAGLCIQPGRWVTPLGRSGGDEGASVGAT